MNANPVLFTILESLSFDVKSGVELCGGDPDFYSELIRELYDDVLPHGAEVLNGSNFQDQREYAHKLKGTLSTLGERSASKAALELERTLRQGTPDPSLAKRLLQDIESMRRSLAAVFEQ